jgi:fructose-bisphosphate aldolase, class I
VVKVNFPHPEKRVSVKSEYDAEFSSQQAIDAVVRSAGHSCWYRAEPRPATTRCWKRAAKSMEAGATGLIFGRNIWQREHDESLRLVDQLNEILAKYPTI